MQKHLVGILLGLLPSFLSKPLHRLRGYRIGKGCRIHIGSFLFCDSFEMGDGGRIGPLAVIKCRQFSAGRHLKTGPAVLVNTPQVVLGHYVQLSGPSVIMSDVVPNAGIRIGDHSRVFPFCWLECGAGISIGQQVAIGGHTQIFTHGYWTSYFKHGQISVGAVSIEDEVYLAWRVFILPGCHIGRQSVVGAGAIVAKSIPAYSVAVGNPARVIKQVPEQALDHSTQVQRLQQVPQGFEQYASFLGHSARLLEPDTVEVAGIRITHAYQALRQPADVLVVLPTPDAPPTESQHLQQRQQGNCIDLHRLHAQVTHRHLTVDLFVRYLRKYGVRLYINHGSTTSY